MKKQFRTVFVIFIAIIMLTACSRNHTKYNAQNEEITREISERISEEITDVGNLSGTLRVLLPKPSVKSPWFGYVIGFIDVYVNRFTKLYPDVEVVFEYYAEDWSYNITGVNYQPTMEQLTALTTKLLADPPDLLIFDPSVLVFEKTNIDRKSIV